MAETTNRDRLQNEKRLYETEGALKYSLARFGDRIAEREGYRENDGIDAVHFYLMQKHGWTPATVLSMSDEHLRFALSEEMAGWTLPREAIVD